MTDIPVFRIVNLIVKDASEYRQYYKSSFPILKRFGGEFVTYDDAAETFEGIAPRLGRMIIFKFPSEDMAKRWYADPQYQEISEHRRAGTQLEFLTMARGLPPRR